MDPRQHEDGRALHRRPWAVVGQAAITAPAIGNHPRAPAPRSRQRRHEGCARRNPRSAPADMRRGSPSGDSSTEPAMRILPCGLRPCPPGPGLLRCGTGGWPHRSRPGPQAGCDPDRPWHGAACAAGARHSCNAEPELGLELQGGDTIRVAGHDVNGHEPGLQGQVAAVHDRACGHRGLLPAAAHSQLARRRFSSPPLSWPQAGQTKPSGQRLAARCRAQEASSGKRASKAARHGAVIQRLAITEHYTNMLPTPTRNSTSRQTGLKGISPIPK